MLGEGLADGTLEGALEGSQDGDELGLEDGELDGASDGLFDGGPDGALWWLRRWRRARVTTTIGHNSERPSIHLCGSIEYTAGCWLPFDVATSAKTL